MAAAVVCDAAVPVDSQKYHLVFPGVCGQGPAVAEDYGSPLAPVFVVDLRSVFGRGRCHVMFSLVRNGGCRSHRVAAGGHRRLADLPFDQSIHGDDPKDQGAAFSLAAGQSHREPDQMQARLTKLQVDKDSLDFVVLVEQLVWFQ